MGGEGDHGPAGAFAVADGDEGGEVVGDFDAITLSAWGVDERAGGIGKTVWVELKAPDIVAEPVGREVAAVMVRPGQHVRAWGAWHAVRTVRTESYAAGGLAIVLGLDEGPALRVHAAEPLTVRDGGVPSTRGSGEGTPG